jgi:hypothetical protein
VNINDMKKRTLIICGLIVILIVAAVLAFRHTKFLATGTEKQSVEQQSKAIVDPQDKAKTVSSPQGKPRNVEAMSNEEKKSIFESLSPKLQKMWIFSEASVSSIEFWGKVVDQHGAPVGEVDVLYYAGGGYLGGGSGFGRLKTDINGLFHITGRKGGSINFREMKKDGYQIALGGQGRIFDSFKKYPASLVWTDYTKKTPYIYQAWKYPEEFEKNKDKLKSGSFQVYFKADGSESSIDVYGPPLQNNKQEFTKAQLKVQLSREAGVTERNPGKWQLVLTPLDGGIIKSESLYTNEAPADGYQQSIIYTQDDLKDSPSSDLKSKLYLTFNGEKIFSRLYIDVTPYFNDEGYMRVQYTVNPTGQRYLDTYDGIPDN